ncbi:MAG: dienelactone hydrolase family protein [Balneolales bacterium]
MIDDSNLYPHQNQPVEKKGAPLSESRAVVIMVHGRGATAESILTLAEEFKQPDVAYLAPQARDNTWYPHTFLAPLSQNSPGISSALLAIGELLEQVEQAGIGKERVVLFGFSQGACLVTEYAARNTGRYGGIVGLSGGLVGPDGASRDYKGSLEQTPVFLGCSDVDFHIPLQRVNETADVLAGLNGRVTKRIYEGMGHTVNQDEVDFIRNLLKDM